MKLVKHDRLNYSFCDTAANLSAVGAFQLVEDAICEMMGELKLDGETCVREYDATWVFVKNRVEIRRPVHWMDEYVIECAITDIGGVKLLVDTVIKSGGNVAVVSRAELCAIDHQSGRIRRANTVGVDDKIKPEKFDVDIEFQKIDFTPIDLLDTVVVRSSDIDFNRHTNNVAYVRYIVNQYDANLRGQRPICAIEIRYINQSFEGDTLKIYRCGDGVFSIYSDDKNVINCTLM